MTSLPAARQEDPAARWIYPVAALLLFAWAVRFYSTTIPNHDVSWFLLAARRLLEGGRYGADLYELNTPGAMLSYAPAAGLWKITGWPLQTCLALYVVGLTTLSLSLIGTLLQRQPEPIGSRLRGAFLLYAAAMLLAVPRYDFGQREHLIVILMLPYCLTGSLIIAEQRPATLLRAIAAALAALAITIKPTYVPLPLVLMAIQARHLGLRAVITSVETRVFLGLGVAYLAGIRLLFPEWITIARQAVELYPAFTNPEYFSAATMRGLAVTAPLLLVGAVLNYRLIRPRSPGLHRWINSMLLFAALALVLFIAQKKGWAYHLLPVKLILVVALGAGVAVVARGYSRARLEAAAVLALVLLTVAVASLSFAYMPRVSRQAYRDIELVQTVNRLATTRVVSAFSSSVGPAFPLVTELGLEWGSRFPHLWPLAGLRYLELNAADRPARLAELRSQEAEFIGMIVADLERYRPSVVIVDEGKSKQALDSGYDFLDRLSQQPEFQAAWRHYTRATTSGKYGLYQRSPGTP